MCRQDLEVDRVWEVRALASAWLVRCAEALGIVELWGCEWHWRAPAGVIVTS